MKPTGQAIIDAIIKGSLCHATCASDPEHNCVVVWSSGAAEQLDAIIARHDPHAETLRLLEEALFHLEYSDLEDAGPAKKRIRAHLARLSKPTAHADGKKGSK